MVAILKDGTLIELGDKVEIKADFGVRIAEADFTKKNGSIVLAEKKK